MPTDHYQYQISKDLPQGRAALIVAHPGHELRIHGWLELAKPLVFVLTDGSGGAGESRLECTRRLLLRVGALPAGIFGRFADRALYHAVISRDYGAFCALVDELTASLEGQGSAYIVGDATEGYNSAHDICRLLIDAAAMVVGARRGHPIQNYAYPLTGSPSAAPPGVLDEPIKLKLDSEAFDRKLRAAEEYAPLHHEVKVAFGGAGRDAFRVECLFPVLLDACSITPPNEPPYYEQYGEKQMKAGRYQSVLRFKEHFMPLREAVSCHVKSQIH